MIEDEIFKRNKINFDKLLEYGFKKDKKSYKYSKKIINDTFRVDITIDYHQKVKGKIYELAFEEEYTNHRIKNQNGEFVNKIRIEFENILNDIKKKCTTTEYFISEQANTITKLIKKKYNHIPEFIWERFPGYGIFRNPNNKKWYALIVNINKSKLDNEAREVEIINLKLKESKIQELLKRKGFYQAYHMDKKNWISIILDNTVKDDEIMKYIEESHKLTEKK